METNRLDCSWCGSARSIEHGICQVCLMEYPLDTTVIQLPLGRTVLDRPTSGRTMLRPPEHVLKLEEREVAEKR